MATIASRAVQPGRFLVQWNGTTRGGRALVYGGFYVIRFAAANELGTVELVSKPVRARVELTVSEHSAVEMDRRRFGALARVLLEAIDDGALTLVRERGGVPAFDLRLASGSVEER